MAFITPIVTDKFIAHPGDVILNKLSLAVWMIDDFTKTKPIGNINVAIKEGNIKALQNLSGYYLFTDLVAGNYTVVVESDLYFPQETTVNTSLLDPKNPVVEVVKKPRSLYPFPEHATLVRGLVSNTVPVVNAEVSVTGKTIKTLTDERGEFVLYFKGINKMEAITIEIRKNGTTKAINTTVEEQKTVSVGKIVFP